MTRFFFLICFLSAQVLFAYDTYIFRMKVDQIRRKSNVDTIFANKGRGQPTDQPFFGTYVLTQPDTNYVLVKVTAKDDAEDVTVKTLFGLPQTDLYQQYHLDKDNGIEMIKDNSGQFPVNVDWTVIRSCPTGK